MAERRCLCSEGECWLVVYFMFPALLRGSGDHGSLHLPRRPKSKPVTPVAYLTFYLIAYLPTCLVELQAVQS